MTAFNWPEAVVILSTRDDVVAGLSPAFEPQPRRDYVTWFEGNHQRMFGVAKVITDTPDKYVFEDSHGDRFELLPMTLDLYHRYVMRRTVGERAYTSLEELMVDMRREW